MEWPEDSLDCRALPPFDASVTGSLCARALSRVFDGLEQLAHEGPPWLHEAMPREPDAGADHVAVGRGPAAVDLIGVREGLLGHVLRGRRLGGGGEGGGEGQQTREALIVGSDSECSE